MATMAMADLLRIARITKSNGTEGEVCAEVFIPYDEIQTEEPVYILFDGLPVPFFIERIVPKGNRKAYLRLTDIEDLEDADELKGKDILIYGKPENDGTPDFEGWTVYDTEGNNVGTVTGFIDIPQNPCLAVEHGDEEIYIPLHEDLIDNYDEEAETITMAIPDGLI